MCVCISLLRPLRCTVYVCVCSYYLQPIYLPHPHHLRHPPSAGLYLVGPEENASQCALSKARIGLDFLLFVKQCLAKGAVPALSWDYAKLLKAAPRLLNRPFAKQRDAIDKYGGENVFDASSGGRSLRYTAEHVYGTSVGNPAFSRDAAYVRIKAEIYRVLPIVLDQPVLPGVPQGYQVAMPDSPQQQAALKRLMGVGKQDADEAKREELEELFSEVGGLAAWRAMISALRFI
jgi:hypothetical protein